MRKPSAKILLVSGVLVSVLVAGVSLVAIQSRAAGPPTTSHSLFFYKPASGGVDLELTCGSNKPYIIYIHFRALDGPASGHVAFGDGDAYGFELGAANEVFSTTQAGGGVPGVDQQLTIVRDTGFLSGWASASSLAGAAVFCDITLTE